MTVFSASEQDKYVDYTPRRINMISFQQTNIPNSITFAKQRRSLYYQQIAQQYDSGAMCDNYMDSPLVRKHLGINERIAAIDLEESLKTKSTQQIVERKDWNIHDFEVGRNLGNGKFGSVYIAREIASSQIVALKILEKKELEEAGVVPFVKREIEIQGHLNHPNIAKLYGYFHNQQRIYLVLEYGGDSDLYTCLLKNKRFSEAQTVNYILKIVDALLYMHRLGVFHRDLKLDNILVSKEGTLKIADFGWAVFDPRPRRRTFCGTLDYLPPEMILHRSYNASVDTWALGVICYELLVGKPPFDREDEDEDYRETYKRIVKARVIFPHDTSREAQKFILKLLQKDPTKRLSIENIELEPWIKRHL